jgi:hypothetical protein
MNKLVLVSAVLLVGVACSLCQANPMPTEQQELETRDVSAERKSGLIDDLLNLLREKESRGLHPQRHHHHDDK